MSKGGGDSGHVVGKGEGGSGPLLRLEWPWGLSPWAWSQVPNFAVEHDEGLHEVV